MQARDWLYVDDHVRGLVKVLEQGATGRTHNIGGNNERNRLDVVETTLRALARRTGKSKEQLLNLIQFVADRPGHDQRNAIDARRMRDALGWIETRTSRRRLTPRWRGLPSIFRGGSVEATSTPAGAWDADWHER